MPTLDVSELNTISAVLGAFTIGFGLIAVKIKSAWYLGEALPAVVVGIILGPVTARLLDAGKWVSDTTIEQDDITLGIMRLMIGIQLVIAGYQLPAKFLHLRWKEMLVCLFPVMTLMWLATSLCVLITIPKITLLATLAIAACVTSTDPILSQAVAKGPFADKYVARPLREMISAEAGANDGFASPFLMLAVELMLHAGAEAGLGREFVSHAGEVTLRSASVGAALADWGLETILYIVLLAMAYGAVTGYLARRAVEFSMSRQWLDTESYLLFPTAMGLFIVGTCGCIGTSDLLACFIAGCALNWDGQFFAETNRRHDEVNSCIDILLNFSGFMYIGITIPWAEFHQPDVTGITVPRLLGLGLLVLFFRRIPALLVTYKAMPAVVKNWKEAIFMGYFGPIGVGAIFYLEHTRLLFPKKEDAVGDELHMLQAIGPVVYFLVLFSIIVHGLSIPALNAVFYFCGVSPLTEDAEEIRRRSIYVATPANAIQCDQDTFLAFNRFKRPSFAGELPVLRDPLHDNEDAKSTMTADTCEVPPEKRRRSSVLPPQKVSVGGTVWV